MIDSAHESHQLPESWLWVKTGDVCDGLVPGRTKPKNFGGDLPWITLPDIDQDLYVSKSKRNLAVFAEEAEAVGMKVMPKGTVLISCVGQFGLVCVASNLVVPNQQLHGFVCLDKISPEYLAYVLKTQVRQMEQMASATTISYLNKTKCNSITFPLSPLNEQRRIVAKIEELTAHSRRAREALDDVPGLINQFRQSVLAAAFRGDLTADWREKNPDVASAEELLEKIQESSEKKAGKKNSKLKSLSHYSNNISEKSLPESWNLIQIHSICLSSFYGPRFSKDEYTSEGVPSIRTTDMSDFGKIIVTDETPRIRIPEDKITLYQVIKDDLLVTRSGSIGVMAIFKDDYVAIPSAYLIRFRFTPLIPIEYIFLYLQSPVGQKLLGLSSTAVTQSNINAEAIKSLPIPLCSQAEQAEVVNRVYKWLTVIDKLEQEHQDVLSDISSLDQSILAKAFQGELVPQDPNDEPASVLLNRIRAEREKLGTTKKKGRTSRKKTKQT